MTATTLAVLEIFAESAQLPSHVRERRLYRRALRERDQRDAHQEYKRLMYDADKFLRRRYYVEPLPPAVVCPDCGVGMGHVRSMRSHRWQCKKRRAA